jgi:predicted membrane channel-forming protein YqfA (hemolysin III family)
VARGLLHTLPAPQRNIQYLEVADSGYPLRLPQSPVLTLAPALTLTVTPTLTLTLALASHLLGAAWVCAMLLETLSMAVTDEGQRFATVVFLVSALFCTVASSLYHLLGGILSQRTYSALYNLDINGISVVIAGSYYPGLRFAFRCMPYTYGAYAWSTLVLLLATAYAANFEVPDVVRVATQVVLVLLGGASATRWC